MIAIKDMKMPNSCDDCQFSVFKAYVSGFFCKAFTGANLIKNRKERQKYCPLVEVKNDKNQ